MLFSLVFTSSGSILSRLIRWFTNGRVSHVAILDVSERVIYEADWKGFVRVPFDEWRHRNDVKFIAHVIDPVTDQARSLLRSWVGHPYGWFEFLGQLIYQLARRLGKTISNPFQNPRGMICSEAAVHLLHFVDKPPDADKLDAEDTSPEALLRYCERSADFSVLRLG